MLSPSIGEQKLEQARQHLRLCGLCEHRCGANRSEGERGPCKADALARVFKHRVEMGEESELIPSHLFYLSGCDLRCAFCVAGINAFDPRRGVVLTSEFFSQAVARGRAEGARTVQWVGGEPTIHLPAILEAMSRCPNVPRVVWKSDFHGTPKAFDLLDGVVDVYLADFKFGNNACAQRVAGISKYVDVVTRNLQIAARQGDLIVRHLLLPGHFDCCYRPIVSWLAAHLSGVKFSIREGYLPSWQAERHEELMRPLARGHAARAVALAMSAGLRTVT